LSFDQAQKRRLAGHVSRLSRFHVLACRRQDSFFIKRDYTFTFEQCS
jgi:hypothetical protein